MPDLISHYEEYLSRTCKDGLWSRKPNGICEFCDMEVELIRKVVPTGRPRVRCQACRKMTVMPKRQLLSRVCMALMKSVDVGEKQAELEFLRKLGIVRLSEEKFEWRGETNVV